MSRRAKAEKSNPVARFHAGHSQAAKADDAGAQQRRSVQVVELWRERIDKIAAGHSILRITAIDGVSGENRRITKIFQAAAAVGTISIDSADPRDTYARSCRQLGGGSSNDVAYDLVAGDYRFLARRQ